MKNARLKPASCLALAGFGAVALMPLASQAQEGGKAPQPLEVLSPIDNGDVKPAPPQCLNPGFGPDLYQQLRKAQGNVFFSPYSISEAMAMVHAGARGNTAKELAAAMRFGNDAKLAERLQGMRQNLMGGVNQKGDQLSIGNALCVTSQVPLQSYQTMVREKFDGELFAGDVDKINAWVEEKTQGKIKQALESLDPDAACALINAVYFKGNWKVPFDADDTRDEYFQLGNDEKVEVKMLAREGHYATALNKEWLAVELPYKGNSSMVCIMPAQADQFAAFEEGISEAFFAEVDKQLSPAANAEKNIFLMLPKFKTAASYNLIPAMRQLGIQDAFSDAADFSAMYERPEIAIAQIMHKATLEVDEMGSVAAAVTVALPQPSCIFDKEPVPEVIFDRPFIVRIRENTTNTTLFMGRISDPTSK